MLWIVFPAAIRHGQMSLYSVTAPLNYEIHDRSISHVQGNSLGNVPIALRRVGIVSD